MQDEKPIDSQELETDSFDDIVFKYRFKGYGAYDLRRRYKRHLLLALLIGAFMVSLFLGIVFWRMHSKEDLINLDDVMIEVDIFDASKISTLETPPEQPPPSAEIPPSNPTILPDSGEPTLAETETNDPKNSTNSDTVVTSKNIEKQIDNNTNTNTSNNPDNTNTTVSTDGSRVGGIEEFKKWVNQNVTYPQEAIAAQKEGRIFVEFWVNEDGSISDVKILKGFAFGMDKAAVEVVMRAPKWKPQPTRKRLTVPVEFRLANLK